MPLTLDSPLVTTIAAYEIRSVNIDMEHGRYEIMVASTDADGSEYSRNQFTLNTNDDLGNMIVPSTWPSTNPTGPQMYAMIKQFLFLMLQDQPGANGLGAGTIS